MSAPMTHGACGKSWQQRGNRTGHCAAERWLYLPLIPVSATGSILRPGRGTESFESSVDGGLILADLLPNLFEAQSGFVQRGRIAIPADDTVKESMFLGSYGEKVFGSVVAPVAVEVVDFLFRDDYATGNPVLVNLDVRVRRDQPSEADISMVSDVTVRLRVGNPFTRKEVSSGHAVAGLAARSAETLLGSSANELVAHGASFGHVAIIRLGALCHETFEGLSLFDAHQRLLPDGQVLCLDPAVMLTGPKEDKKPLRLINGSWRGPAMPTGVFGGTS